MIRKYIVFLTEVVQCSCNLYCNYHHWFCKLFSKTFKLSSLYPDMFSFDLSVLLKVKTLNANTTIFFSF